MASARVPVGWPPAFGARQFQKKVWFQTWAALLKMPPEEGLDDGFQILAFELGAWDQVVQIGHVGSVVLVVMVVERLGGHVRLEGVLFVKAAAAIRKP